MIAASAAETGTKTLPDSSIYAPAAPEPVYDLRLYPHQHFDGCYMPSDGCDNEYSVQN
jgi:hypothetical protein